MRYSHVGVPTTQEKNWAGYVKELGVHFVDPSTEPFKIEWLKFDADSPMDKAIQTNLHVAYQVDDIEAAVADAVAKGKKVLMAPMSPLPGLLLAYIDHEGVVVEFSQLVG